jgi:4-hydroxy-2-oxoheptanedioate aldolase
MMSSAVGLYLSEKTCLLTLIFQEEARALVSFAKFPIPRSQQGPGVFSGIRGVGSPFAPAAFGQTPREYTATANDNILIAVQIESVEGLNNCEEIAKVDGIGM